MKQTLLALAITTIKASVTVAVCWVGFRFGILRMVFMGTSDV